MYDISVILIQIYMQVGELFPKLLGRTDRWTDSDI